MTWLELAWPEVASGVNDWRVAKEVMCVPLEKVYSICGNAMLMKQVIDPSKLSPVDVKAFYFIQMPLDSVTAPHPAWSHKLPLMIPVQTSDWYFIRTAGRTWEEHLACLKTSHAKKLRRYSRKPAKYGYTIMNHAPHYFTPKRACRCYELLCETMAYNSDTNFFTEESFAAHIRSLPEGVLVAAREDGRILGFYSGAVIGHDHSAGLKSWGVYHNLFIEYVKREIARGGSIVDLGNTNDNFKQELGGKGTTVNFELRSGMSLRSAFCLAAWALSSLVSDDNRICRAVKDAKWGLLILWTLCALAAMVFTIWVLQSLLHFRLIDVVLFCGLCYFAWSHLQRA